MQSPITSSNTTEATVKSESPKKWYKAKLISVGITPTGYIAIGIVPMGVISIGIVPMGVISIGTVSMGAIAAGFVSMGLFTVGQVTMSLNGHQGHQAAPTMTMPQSPDATHNSEHSH